MSGSQEASFIHNTEKFINTQAERDVEETIGHYKSAVWERYPGWEYTFQSHQQMENVYIHKKLNKLLNIDRLRKIRQSFGMPKVLGNCGDRKGNRERTSSEIREKPRK